MDLNTGVIADPGNQILDDDGRFYAILRHDNIKRERRLCPFLLCGWRLRKGFLNFFCQIIIGIICLVFLVQCFTLPPMKFSPAGRTTGSLAPLLSDIRQKPFSADRTRALSTGILSHHIFSRI